MSFKSLLAKASLFLALILVAAHFLRAGEPLLSLLIVLSFVFSFFGKLRIIPLIVVTLGEVIYAFTTYKLISFRLSEGLPYKPVLLIMVSVMILIAALTAVYYLLDKSS